MKTEKEVKARLEDELDNLSIDTYIENVAKFFTDFGFMKGLRAVLDK